MCINEQCFIGPRENKFLSNKKLQFTNQCTYKAITINEMKKKKKTINNYSLLIN